MTEFKVLILFAIKSIFQGMPNYHVLADIIFTRFLLLLLEPPWREAAQDIQSAVGQMLLGTVVTAHAGAADLFVPRV